MCYLAQGELHSSQEVVVLEVDGLVVDVVDGELELLHRLKVVVHLQTLAEGRAVAVLHPLCPPHLRDRHDPLVITFTHIHTHIQTHVHSHTYTFFNLYADFLRIIIAVNHMDGLAPRSTGKQTKQQSLIIA